MRVRFLEAARHELADAAEYIERRRAGFGELLEEEVFRVLERVLERPRSGARIDVPRDAEVRAFFVPRFHYTLFVLLSDAEAIVLAAAHQSRSPGYWVERLDGP